MEGSTMWKDSAKGMGGSSKTPKKSVREIRTRKGKSGGYIHEHHHESPEHHPMEEHMSPDQNAMLAHMASAMPNGPAQAAPMDDGSADASGGAAPAAPPAGAPPPSGPPAPAGGM